MKRIQTLSLVSPRGTLNTRAYDAAVPAEREAAMAALVAIRNRWQSNAPHMVDGPLTITDSADAAAAAPTAHGRAINAAYAADAVFGPAVIAAGFNSRWDRGVSDHPAVRDAFAAKVAADRAVSAAFEADRLACAQSHPKPR